MSLVLLITVTYFGFGQTDTSYKAMVMTTTFTVPTVRFDRTEGSSDKKGDVSFFNSVGAGIAFNLSKLISTVDSKDPTKVYKTEIYNRIGLQIGCLFSASGGENNDTNIFAPTISLNMLDFNIGYGCELGTLDPSHKRGFFTIAYSVPLSSLSKKGYVLLSKLGKTNDNDKKTAKILSQ